MSSFCLKLEKPDGSIEEINWWSNSKRLEICASIEDAQKLVAEW